MLKEISESEDSFVDEEEKTPTGSAKGTKEDVGGTEGREKRTVDPSLAPTIPTHSDQGEIKLEVPEQKQGKQEMGERDNEAAQDRGEEGGKGDPEMAVVYIKALLPVFADLFHSSQAAAVKKKILPIIHKLSHHVTAEWLQELCQVTEEPSFLSQICELVALTIDSEVRMECEGLVASSSGCGIQ